MLETSHFGIDLRFAKNTNRKTRATYRKFISVMTTYNGFQVLFAEFIQCTKIAILTQHIGAISLLILCPFSTLEFWGMHNFTTIPNALSYLVFPGGTAIFGVWVLLIQKLPASLYESSSQVMTAWARTTYTLGKDERKIRTSYILSMKAINLPVGNFFYYRTSTMPNVVNMCVDQIVSLLIASN